MKTKIITALVLTLFLLSVPSVLVPVSASSVEWHVHPGESIQLTISDASAGDTIIVHAGTYTETIAVDKPLTLKGKGATIEYINGGFLPAVSVLAPDVTIDGFTITTEMIGIQMMFVSNVRITNNLIDAAVGIMAMSAPRLHIRNNEISALWWGIFASGSNLAITKNTIHTMALFGSMGITAGGDNCRIFDNEVYCTNPVIELASGISYGGINGIIARNIVSGFVMGITLDGPTSQTKVCHNTITGTIESDDIGIQLGFSTSENMIMLNKISDVDTEILDYGTENKLFNN